MFAKEYKKITMSFDVVLPMKIDELLCIVVYVTVYVKLMSKWLVPV